MCRRPGEDIRVAMKCVDNGGVGELGHLELHDAALVGPEQQLRRGGDVDTHGEGPRPMLAQARGLAPAWIGDSGSTDVRVPLLVL